MKLSLDFISKPIEPFQYPYYRIYWNGSCYLEDTVEDKTVDLDVDVNEGWNSFIFEVIDVFDVFDPLDGQLLAQTTYDIIDLRLNDQNYWPIKTANNTISKVNFHSDHMTWYASREPNAKIQGKVNSHFAGKGFTELKFFVEQGKITDHYYSGRKDINFFHWLCEDGIQADCYSSNLFGLSNTRLKNLYTTVKNTEQNTFESEWLGRSVKFKEFDFKDKLAQWISARPWPFRWIHASYFGKQIPIELANELLNA